VTDVRSLSIHSGYRCRHAGACCTSNWPIPVEAEGLEALQAAIARNQLRPARGDTGTAIVRPADAPAETPAMLGRCESRCVFYADAPLAGGGRCRVQAALGHDALPLACRQFPRVSVHDPRGASVTLSHYCPTAAALLDADTLAQPTVVLNAPAFPATVEYVGLDVREALPPLLRRGMLMDWESWWECERLAVELLGAEDHDSAATALARLHLAVTEVTAWSPTDGPLIDRVRDAFARAPARARNAAPRPSAQLIDAVYRAIPAGIRPTRFAHAATSSDRATRRFLVAHAFANWTAHLGQGLEPWLRSIEAAAALLDAGAGVRHADLLLRHLLDPRTLAEGL
jgi:hypothetical protein